MLALLLWSVLSGAAHSADFKFSEADKEEEAQEKQEQAVEQARIAGQLGTPCKNKIKNQKILVLFGESQNGQVQASQSNFNPYSDAINSRLRALGLKTYTRAQIRQQVAQAEIDAYFKNDPDAAISASKRMAAQYILKGLITTEARYNQAVNVNQVSIRMDFTLTGANGKMISQARAENASYAGHDTSGLALTLINERADALVASLYSDYCQRAGVR